MLPLALNRRMLRASKATEGFTFEDQRVPLIAPQGIFKPRLLPEIPLSITTVPIVEGQDRPVFIFNYPKEAKAFYMKENPADPRTVLCDDLLAPEGYGEIIGGSQREDDHDKLLARIKHEGLPVEAYNWYLDLRKYGTFVHAGFGLGLERTVF